jgi:hypothetical protein
MSAGRGGRRLAHGPCHIKRAGRLGSGFVLATVALVACFTGAVAQAPDEEWRTLTTEHFRVTFPAHLEEVGRKAADRSERAYAELSSLFLRPPDGVIDVLVTDHTDVSNGFAQVTPSNRITVFARPPADALSLGHMDDWLELVITHELAHIVHLDYVRNPIGLLARSVFGRVSLEWPFFPELASPRWVSEGLATWYESRLTEAGRIRGTFNEMQLRTALLEGRFENIGQASGDSPLWPGGNRSYAYGSLFFAHMLDRHGEERMTDFVRAIGGQWIPYRLDAAGRDAFGVSLTDAWQEWRDSLEQDLAKLDGRLERLMPITESERLTTDARWALHPTTSPDGRWLAYARSDGRSDIQLRIRDLTTGRDRSLGRTNGLATYDWLGADSLLVSQLELDDPYRLFGDLYVFGLDGGERRITQGARLTQPSGLPGGRAAIAVQEGEGTNALVRVDLTTGEVAPLVGARPDAHWALPAVSPDGRWIAATRWMPDANHDVVVLDARSGAVVTEVTRDRALDMGPRWSPDGRWLVWASDRTGILNVLGAEIDPGTGAASAPRMLTNVRTGAAYPSVDASGARLYYSGYHVDGWEVERTPFVTEGRPVAPPPAPRFAAEEAPPERRAAAGEVHDYSALSTLAPTFWEISYTDAIETPAFQTDELFLRRRELLGPGLGIQTSGRDLVLRHAYTAYARVRTTGGKIEGGASYSYAGLGNPVLSLSASQGWIDGGQQVAGADQDTLFVLERERFVEGAVTFLAPSYRRGLSLTVGTAMVWEHRELLDVDLEPSGTYSLARPSSRLADFTASINLNSSRTHSFQMGTARGVAVFLQGRLRRELSVPDSLAGVAGADRSLREVVGRVRGSIPLWGGGFATHVLALQMGGAVAAGPGAGVLQYRVGGASGQQESLTGLELFGGDFLLFPVRGYDTSSRFGRFAWSGSAEYRFPLWLVNRGLQAWPLHVDRIVGALFADVGNAWGPDLSPNGFPNALQVALASVGAEVTTEILGLYDTQLRLRVGAALPLVEGDGARVYLRVGLPF